MANDEARRVDDQAALRALAEETAGETGDRFYGALVEALARVLGTRGAWVTEYVEERGRLRALAFWLGGERLDGLEYDIEGTPCEIAIRESRLVEVPDGLPKAFGGPPGKPPNDLDRHLGRHGVVSYMGVPLLDDGTRVIGHLAVLDVEPLVCDERMHAVFRIFANRALAEMRRQRLERDLRDREEKLAGVIGGAMDAIVELDGAGNVTLMNAAAERIFGCSAESVRGGPFARLMTRESAGKLDVLLRDLDGYPEGRRSTWIAGGLVARHLDGSEFAAEATVSRYEVGRRPFSSLILRNVDDRLEAERRIRRLVAEAEYLRDEIRSDRDLGGIIGRSPAMSSVLRDIEQVGPADTSVLITGETGTGKELVARAVHEASPRRHRPVVVVNCAALPASLIESELFGHEKGAFTGAMQRRIGRFEVADGGTLFLDEVGELPLDLQAKLLRVLQEGEIQPIGSAGTRKVDVRILAATNRDLARAVREGSFREDLFYRLNVFPLRLPPLRERGDDVVRIAESVAEALSQKLGRPWQPLDRDDVAALRSYAWPGNVRELRNVIERALLTSADGRLQLWRIVGGKLPPPAGPTEPADAGKVLTLEDLKDLERANLVRALEATGWRIAGRGGAAELLGTRPSTLRSRIAALGIEKPATVG